MRGRSQGAAEGEAETGTETRRPEAQEPCVWVEPSTGRRPAQGRQDRPTQAQKDGLRAGRGGPADEKLPGRGERRRATHNTDMETKKDRLQERRKQGQDGCP